MSVIRNKRRQHFTIAPNAALRNGQLSLQAKGLLALLLSFPDDWDYVLSHIEGLSSNGRDAHRAAMHELEQAGYVWKTRARGEQGRIAGWNYTVSDAPMTENPSSVTEDGLPDVGLPDAGEPATTKNHSTKTEGTKTTPPTPQQAAAPPKAPVEEEVEEEVRTRTPPRNGNQIQGLMQRHPTTWEALCRVKNDREWKRAQFQAIAGRVYRLAELHGERECTAALTDLLVAGDQVRHPLRWLEAALADDPPATEAAGGKSEPRSTLLEELRAARSGP